MDTKDSFRRNVGVAQLLVIEYIGKSCHLDSPGGVWQVIENQWKAISL